MLYCTLGEFNRKIKQDNTKKLKEKHQQYYTPSPQMADKLAHNRNGQLTKTQKAPILVAAILSGIMLFIVSAFSLLMIFATLQTLAATGVFGVLMLLFMGGSFIFLAIVLYTNAEMFIPEAIGSNVVRAERGKLKIKMASRERPEMPFSYIVGKYSFAPFVVPHEVPMEKNREYIVYYTSRSRLLLSIAPINQENSKEWLPK